MHKQIKSVMQNLADIDFNNFDQNPTSKIEYNSIRRVLEGGLWFPVQNIDPSLLTAELEKYGE